MRQVLPTPLESVDIPTLYRSDKRPAPPNRPWLLANMVTSIDGATAVEGVSAALGGEGDKAVFRAVRAVADVIVVGAGTAVAENYGPPIVSDELQAVRTANAQTSVPGIVVVSNTLSAIFDGPDGLNSKLFQTPGFRPTVVTSGVAPQDRADALRDVADVHVLGEAEVDLIAMFAMLRANNATCALVEGGPTLNGHLLAADLLDEVVLTFAPALVGGRSGRFASHDVASLNPMILDRVLEAESHLFFRYLRDRAS